MEAEMFRWALRIGLATFLAGATACQSPDESTCRSACSNVVRALASELQGVDDAAMASLLSQAEDSLDGCLESCREQSATHVRCLASATTAKAVSECVGQGF